MNQVYFNIYFKGSSQPPISIPEHIYDTFRATILAKEDTLLEFGDITFNPKDIRYVKRFQGVDYRAIDQTIPQITEEQRQKNLRRLVILKDYFFGGKYLSRTRVVPSNPEDWVNPYHELKNLAKMTHTELRAFNKEFFDVAFDDHDHRDQVAGLWLAYARSERDPRDYSRDTILQDVLH